MSQPKILPVREIYLDENADGSRFASNPGHIFVLGWNNFTAAPPRARSSSGYVRRQEITMRFTFGRGSSHRSLLEEYPTQRTPDLQRCSDQSSEGDDRASLIWPWEQFENSPKIEWSDENEPIKTKKCPMTPNFRKTSSSQSSTASPKGKPSQPAWKRRFMSMKTPSSMEDNNSILDKQVVRVTRPIPRYPLKVAQHPEAPQQQKKKKSSKSRDRSPTREHTLQKNRRSASVKPNKKSKSAPSTKSKSSKSHSRSKSLPAPRSQQQNVFHVTRILPYDGRRSSSTNRNSAEELAKELLTGPEADLLHVMGRVRSNLTDMFEQLQPDGHFTEESSCSEVDSSSEERMVREYVDDADGCNMGEGCKTTTMELGSEIKVMAEILWSEAVLKCTPPTTTRKESSKRGTHKDRRKRSSSSRRR